MAPIEFFSLGTPTFDLHFCTSLLTIIVINLVLSGDNAVVIAMAVRSLPRNQRINGIMIGSGAAVVLRIVLTFFAAQLLEVPYLKLIGGILIAWIAIKLFLDDSSDHDHAENGGGFMHALKTILLADLVMSIDNVLAIAAASKGSVFLLGFGLAVSIPLVVGTSTLLMRLMDRHPSIILAGAAILGKVAGEMIISDPVVVAWLHPDTIMAYGAEIVFAVGVVIAGKWMVRRRIRREEAALSGKSSC